MNTLLKRLLTAGIFLLVSILITYLTEYNNTAQASEETKEYGGFTYEVRETGINIIKYNGNETDVVIFDELNGIKVTGIGSYAFYGCSNLKNIIIPESVVEIGYEAFSECTNLESINISEHVTSIWSDAFRGCSCLEIIIVDENNKVYDSRDNCNAIIYTATNTLVVGCRNTIIPKNVTRIGSSAFKDCSSLTSINIPSGVKEIGDSAFKGCSSLISVSLHEGLISIDWTAFESCSSLISINIPASVTSIGHGAFYNCAGLTSIKVHKNNTVYDSRNDCNAIIETAYNGLVTGCKNTVIPESVTDIDRGAFKGCSNLTHLYIPESVISIMNGAFDGCNNLVLYGKTGSYAETYAKEKNISFIIVGEKDSDTNDSSRTGSNSSDNSNSATTQKSGGSTEVNTGDKGTASSKTPAKKGTTLTVASKKLKVKVTSSKASNPTVAVVGTTNKKAKTITIPATVKVNGVTYKVTSIANNAFKGNKKLTKVTVGKNVTKIGKNVFSGCKNLKKLTMTAGKLKTISKNAFKGINKKASITLKGTKKAKTALRKKLKKSSIGYVKTWTIK
jgi:hypothetical protein